MKLRLRSIVVLLLLGAIANVAVAWWIDFLRQPTMAQMAAATTAPVLQAIQDRPRFFPLRQPGWHQCGWPYDTLLRRDRLPSDATTWIVWRDGLRVPLPTGNVLDRDAIHLPVLPAYGGFAINTLFYAGALWVLFATPFALRRAIRRRRGLCAACAYPIGSSEVCTECGKDLGRRQ